MSLRRPRHQHHWVETKRFGTPPVIKLMGIERMSERLLKELLSGSTTIELRCTECGDIAFRSAPGYDGATKP